MSWNRVRVSQWGGPEVLHLETLDTIPVPAPGEALVRVEAAGVGYTDTIVRRGKYIDYKGGLPMTPGYDVAGTIVSLGEGASGPAPGTAVCDMPMNGGYARYICRPADSLVPVPEGVSFVQAVQVPLMYMTAWQMLTRVVDLPEGAAILVVGASGSVGRALTKLAIHRGLKVIGTASARNLGAVRALGADAIDYHRPDLARIIREAGNGGVLAAFDAIGGDSWKTSWHALAKGGTLVGYGLQDFLDSGGGALNAIASFGRLKLTFPLRAAIDRSRRRTHFYNILQRRSTHPGDYRADAEAVLGLIASGAINADPVESLPLSAAPDAHRRIARGGMSQRLVLLPGE